MDQLTQSITADRRRRRDRLIVIGVVLVVLVAAAAGVTLWSGVGGDETSPGRGFCDRLTLGGLGEFGEVDGGQVIESREGETVTCTGTYRDGAVTLTVTVQGFDDVFAARSAFEAVPPLSNSAAPGLGDSPAGWDDVRHEFNGGETQNVLLKDNTLAVVLLDLPMEVAPGDMEAAWQAVSGTSSKVLEALAQ